MYIRPILDGTRLVCLAIAASASAAWADEKAAAGNPYAEEAKADLRVGYYGNGKLDIGVGEVQPGGARIVTGFTFDEVMSFFQQQKHKQMVVVEMGTRDRNQEERNALARQLNDYFFKVGFHRVLIRSNDAGLDYVVVSDAINPNATTR
jgi:hypothetical protein